GGAFVRTLRRTTTETDVHVDVQVSAERRIGRAPQRRFRAEKAAPTNATSIGRRRATARVFPFPCVTAQIEELVGDAARATGEARHGDERVRQRTVLPIARRRCVRRPIGKGDLPGIRTGRVPFIERWIGESAEKSGPSADATA